MNSKGSVIWITGLSGAGKSTLARKVVSKLRSNGQAVIFLDGDELRAVFGAVSTSKKNHGREGRIELAMQYSNLCLLLSIQGFIVVIATISLFDEIHKWNRENLLNYFEVFLDVPIGELRRRNSKDIYGKFDRGELSNVAGLDLNVDTPRNPDWIVEFNSNRLPENIAEELLNRFNQRKNHEN
jgi:adenylylsulfate kinase-like enzyme